MSWYDNYVSNMAQNNRDYYEEFAQEWVNDYFEDSTLVRIIQEQEYPFSNKYNEYECHIDSVAEVSTNIEKVMGDFIGVVFKDCSHINYRGQKYIYDDETYLCYDKINELSKVASTKLIRCNNSISWLDENGNINTEKVFLGYELTSTNDLVAKQANIPNRRRAIYIQSNDKTKKIRLNQRFMIEHNQCFRVEEIDNYNQESHTNGDVTLMKLFLVYSPIIPNDNQELNVCDYYDNYNYTLEIDQDNIQQVKNANGQFTATIKLNNDVVDMEKIWYADNSVIKIDQNGYYTVVGNIGDKTQVECHLKDNDDIFDIIQFEIVDDYLPEKKLIVSPNGNLELDQLENIDINFGVYIEGQKQADKVSYSASNLDTRYYEIRETLDGINVTNNLSSSKPLIITFSADGCEDIAISIQLNSFI